VIGYSIAAGDKYKLRIAVNIINKSHSIFWRDAAVSGRRLVGLIFGQLTFIYFSQREGSTTDRVKAYGTRSATSLQFWKMMARSTHAVISVLNGPMKSNVLCQMLFFNVFYSLFLKCLLLFFPFLIYRLSSSFFNFFSIIFFYNNIFFKCIY